ncbi:MAG: rhodanese-like domain-containing protein [Gammaproteobacteria bacterium]|jgi:rhodanese-related sulfurtransferase|uniref:rhodanese-like domain-containing protein n=1 Tax=Methylotuvimicrobium sp. TaxID=2822413 RepID=UPI001D793603|nr:rhodanese-like domain-containing protein [Gammaproteobacteria bacterium]
MVENLEPKQAWQLLQTDRSAVLIDVRTKMEHSHVGHPIGAVHIPWKEYPDWQVNSSFVEQVAEAVPDKNAPVLLLCRSGQRSLDAAAALAAAGYSRPINILQGFEGPLDDGKHRGNRGGWRFHDLPWEQS